MTRYSAHIAWSEEEGAYLAVARELPGCIADGATPEEALQNLNLVAQDWVETAKELGRKVPGPATVEKLSAAQDKFHADTQRDIDQYVAARVRDAVNAARSNLFSVIPDPRFSGIESAVSWEVRGALGVLKRGEIPMQNKRDQPDTGMMIKGDRAGKTHSGSKRA